MGAAIIQAKSIPNKHQKRFTISELLSYFKKELKNPNNYLRIVKRYLEYCLEEKFSIDDVSFQLYTVGQKGNIKSPVKKFVKFANSHHIFEVIPDPKEKEIPPAANELILGFISHSYNLSEETKITYTKSLNNFFFFLEKENLNFSGRSVAIYLQSLKREELSAFTIALRLSSIKQLAGWIIQNRHRLPFELKNEQLEALRDIGFIKSPKLEKLYHKDGLTEDQRSILIEQIRERKWRAILSLMAYEGLRTIEITRLKVNDLDFKENKLYVLGKGKDQKIGIWLLTKSAYYLKEYIEEECLDYSLNLFPDINTRQIRYHTTKYLIELGIKTKKKSTHSLRHTAGQVLLKKGVDLSQVQLQLRHKDVSSTQIYVIQQIKDDFFSKRPLKE